MRKCVIGHMRTAKAQIRLRIHAVWSVPSMSAYRIIGYYRIYEWRAKTRMVRCASTGWYESVYFAHARRHFFACLGKLISAYDSKCSLGTDIFWIDSELDNSLGEIILVERTDKKSWTEKIVFILWMFFHLRHCNLFKNFKSMFYLYNDKWLFSLTLMHFPAFLIGGNNWRALLAVKPNTRGTTFRQ